MNGNCVSGKLFLQNNPHKGIATIIGYFYNSSMIVMINLVQMTMTDECLFGIASCEYNVCEDDSQQRIVD